MANVKISIEPLNGENYVVWSQRMEMLLVHKKLWKGVTELEADADSPDHMKRDCPKRGKSKNSQGVAFTAVEEVDPGQWFLDSGASQHMTGDKSLFKTLEPLKDGE
ncbi:unnamed protein product [Sphagnum jensenii]|uniref:DUF4219 domain-containing protein n=1 Tax=Sphagnum jensenii TaxID=128206 RepID=A0ABP1BN67_9BRYO